MKNIFTFLTLFTFSSLFAIDRFVDPNLSSGNGTTLFTNITSAVAAAVNGDRIIISSNTYNEATLTISKSLKIMPQIAGTTININANIIVAGFSGMKLEIMGINLGNYSITGNVFCTSFCENINKAKITIIECNCNNINFDNLAYKIYLIKNNFNDVTIRFGKLVLNTMANCYINDDGDSNEHILITNNNIAGSLIYYNATCKLIIANNSLKNLLIKRWNTNTNIKNIIINNEFSANSQIGFSNFDVPYYNIIFSSNIINAPVTYLKYNRDDYILGCPGGNGAKLGFYSSPSLNCCAPIICTDLGDSFTYTDANPAYFRTTNSPNPNVGGTFEWSYNSLDYNCIMPTSTQPLSIIRTGNGGSIVDGGNPNHNFYDIDLTVNDKGRNGGPYSIYNYIPTSNSNNSKAFIFDLDMPTDLFPGQSVNITADGYHKN
jgi:hypothetical protein